jgi:hypothetical protein
MTQPDITGRAGRAWKFKIDAREAAAKPHALDAYLIHQPNVHAIWSWWLFTGCDLYDDPDSATWGKLEPKKVSPGMTHEFICYALSPESGHYAGTEPPEGWDSTEASNPARVFRHHMVPMEFVHQERLRDSDDAREIQRLFVQAVCDGKTAADADFRGRNVMMLKATAEHFRQGKHDVL